MTTTATGTTVTRIDADGVATVTLQSPGLSARSRAELTDVSGRSRRTTPRAVVLTGAGRCPTSTRTPGCRPRRSGGRPGTTSCRSCWRRSTRAAAASATPSSRTRPGCSPSPGTRPAQRAARWPHRPAAAPRLTGRAAHRRLPAAGSGRRGAAPVDPGHGLPACRGPRRRARRRPDPGRRRGRRVLHVRRSARWTTARPAPHRGLILSYPPAMLSPSGSHRRRRRRSSRPSHRRVREEARR